ncbi:hypothetical protein D3C76_1243560 [compost metagenome]
MLVVVQTDQASADQVRQPTAHRRIHQRTPEHVAGDGVAEHLDAARHAPQNDRERHQADHGTQQPQAQAQGVGGKTVEVFGNPLVRVIGITALLQSVIVLVIEPTGKMLLRQPGPPANGEHLREVQAIDGAEDRHRRDAAEIQDQLPEGRAVLLLQGVVEILVPTVDPHRDRHAEQRECDDGDQQRPGLALLLTAPVRRGHLPDTAEKLPAHRVIDRGIFSVLIHG